ncbi:KpsF/GutQ family sugar-phosphate isomerase [Photobacterium rosenbergii]|uniref:Arabinose 5-phosphate isomerase n=1 Tax=Photobacterium rosenbergii TaxID=294936 RepID=A0ABU3ZPT8_9GAMM|nr:KpsF/GutQ family sugar-phosphate isomerase [Photobacterium rosenbergii]MDV5172128.1 KpsF/GutQ family sugar-phosphate isomerase [Photobacterium rosenbergii]
MSVIERAREVIRTEISGLEFMATQLGQSFEAAVEAILNTKGRTIICGMGKSGIIGKKIAASFASTGTAGFFMHPGEAFHGDLGMVKPEDVFIAISNSGETDEVLKLLPFLRDNGNFIIAITGRPDSTLAQAAHCHLDIAVPQEACPLQLAPTASTTATLAMGDALTICLMEQRNFKPENFARFHPGGSLGRRLLGRVSDDMVSDNLPVIHMHSELPEIIAKISEGRLGLAVVMCDDQLKGIITDGDLRRTIEKFGKDSFSVTAESIFSPSPVTVSPQTSIQSAYELMDSSKISALVVVDDNNLVGILKK